MLLEELTSALEESFPDLLFSSNRRDNFIIIPEKSDKVGPITIYDESLELTIEVGNFTHWHASCDDDSLDVKTKEKHMVSEVVEFLSDLFNEKIVMWGSIESAGGFYNIECNLDEQDAPLQSDNEDMYVWSGKKIC